MDDSDLVQRYKEKAREWIFQKSNHKYTIEDDEILDLDSLSFDSDEDTWLYSSDEKSSIVEITPDDKSFGSISSNFNDKLTNSTISPLSPLIDVNNFSLSDSLVHLPDVSLGTLDHFLTRTPFEDRKPKSLIKTALCNQFHANHIIADEKNGSESPSMTSKTELNAFHKPDNAYRSLSNTTVSITKKNRSNNELADKSYVLHSVENKLFTITDADTNDTFSKTCQNRDPRNQKVGEDGSIANALVDNLKSNLPSAKANDFSNTKEYEKKLSYNKCAKTTPENDENDHRSTGKKNAPICQSTPMLLGRYLKYNKTIDDSKNFSTWRTSAEFLKDDDDEIANDGGQHQMNVSYIKETSPLPEPNKSGDSFSKLENYLNSTYDIQEDDQASSTSESSVSSFGNKPTYSIRDVQKNAELQERSKPKCFAIFSFAGRPFNKYEQNTKNVPTSGANTTIESTSQFSSTTRGRNSSDGSPNIQNATFTSKLSIMKHTRNDSPSKERKSSEDLTKSASRRSVSPGPVSHIPRPSSRIPKLRSRYRSILRRVR
ncbi:hypothetical protein U1Q18_045294 [Sarracenia purpurea var. burkii]